MTQRQNTPLDTRHETAYTQHPGRCFPDRINGNSAGRDLFEATMSALEHRIALIRARIADRDGKPGYKRNVLALKAELAKLQRQAATATPQVDTTQRTA